MKNPKIYDTYEDFQEDFEISALDSVGFTNKLREQGHDGIMIENSTTDTGTLRNDYVVFDGNQLRVPWAKFDPKKDYSRNTLAGGAGVSAVGLTGEPDG